MVDGNMCRQVGIETTVKMCLPVDRRPDLLTTAHRFNAYLSTADSKNMS